MPFHPHVRFVHDLARYELPHTWFILQADRVFASPDIIWLVAHTFGYQQI